MFFVFLFIGFEPFLYESCNDIHWPLCLVVIAFVIFSLLFENFY